MLREVVRGSKAVSFVVSSLLKTCCICRSRFSFRIRFLQLPGKWGSVDISCVSFEICSLHFFFLVELLVQIFFRLNAKLESAPNFELFLSNVRFLAGSI